MYRRYNLTYFLLASVVALGLVLLLMVVDAQAQITFVSHRDGNPEIYVMDADGRNQRRLTNNRHNDWNPSWSSDGKHIVFFSNKAGHVIDGIPTSEIYVMDANRGIQRNLTNDPNDDRDPAWSPDGKRIVFASDRDKKFSDDIYVMDADGGNPQNLTNDFNDDRFPSWSPDGKRIVFVSHRVGHFIGDSGITSEIYVMDADGGNQQRLTENRKNDWNPSWSPDGKRIAFSSDGEGDLKNFDIYVMDVDGGNQQRLTENHHEDSSPSWSPDGKRIAFSSNRKENRDNFDIYVMDANGDNPQNLTNNPRADVSPAWLGPAFSVSPTGKKFTMWGRLKQVDR